MTSASDLPLGSKSEPPLPPPIASVVRRVLENLLESQEFEDAEVHRGMEAQAAFVGADGAVHFDAKAAVDLDVASVIHPRNPEHDHAFRFDDAFHDPGLPIFRMLIEDRSDRFQNFGYGLMELCFVGVVWQDDLLQYWTGQLHHIGFSRAK